MKQGYDYHVLSISLANLAQEKEYNINGGLIQFISGAGTINVRLNSNDADQIPLVLNKGIQAPFTKLFISSSDTGTIKLYISSDKNIKFTGDEFNVNTISEITHITNVDSIDLISSVDSCRNFPSVNANCGKTTITSTESDITIDVARRDNMIIKNTGIVTAYLGVAGVTPNTGYPLRPGETLVLRATNYHHKAICETGESTILRRYQY